MRTSAVSSEPDEKRSADRRAWMKWIAIGLVAGGATFAFWWIRNGDSVPAVEPRVAQAPRAGARPGTASITQIMIMYDRDRGGLKPRLTKAEANELCKSLIARIRKGESLESLLNEYTDDRGDDGKPFNRGDFTIASSSPTVAAIKKAAFSTPIGELAPEPIDSGLAFHVIRRDL